MSRRGLDLAHLKVEVIVCAQVDSSNSPIKNPGQHQQQENHQDGAPSGTERSHNDLDLLGFPEQLDNTQDAGRLAQLAQTQRHGHPGDRQERDAEVEAVPSRCRIPIWGKGGSGEGGEV